MFNKILRDSVNNIISEMTEENLDKSVISSDVEYAIPDYSKDEAIEYLYSEVTQSETSHENALKNIEKIAKNLNLDMKEYYDDVISSVASMIQTDDRFELSNLEQEEDTVFENISKTCAIIYSEGMLTCRDTGEIIFENVEMLEDVFKKHSVSDVCVLFDSENVEIMNELAIRFRNELKVMLFSDRSFDMKFLNSLMEDLKIGCIDDIVILSDSSENFKNCEEAADMLNMKSTYMM